VPVVDLLRAGVPVITEKPLAHRLAAGEEIVRVAAETGTKIGVCFQNRYNATSQAIQELLGSGRLGAVLGGTGTVTWHRPEAYYRAKPWRATWERSGGGVMINQAIHTLDLLQWLLGDVVAVSGTASRRVPLAGVEVEDTADLVLDHHGGARSVMFASNANVVDSPVTLEIATEHAVLFVRGDLTVSWADGTTEVVAERRLESSGRAYWGASHRLLIEDFYDRLDDPEPFWISAAEGLKTLQILNRLYAAGEHRPARNPDEREND
jgi:predicted dehydrogenase